MVVSSFVCLALVVFRSTSSALVVSSFTRSAEVVFVLIYSRLVVFCSAVGIFGSVFSTVVVFYSSMGMFIPVISAVVVIYSALVVFSSISSGGLQLCPGGPMYYPSFWGRSGPTLESGPSIPPPVHFHSRLLVLLL